MLDEQWASVDGHRGYSIYGTSHKPPPQALISCTRQLVREGEYLPQPRILIFINGIIVICLGNVLVSLGIYTYRPYQVVCLQIWCFLASISCLTHLHL